MIMFFIIIIIINLFPSDCHEKFVWDKERNIGLDKSFYMQAQQQNTHK